MCKFFFNFDAIFNMYIVLTLEWINQYLKYFLLDMGWLMLNPLLSRFMVVEKGLYETLNAVS